MLLLSSCSIMSDSLKGLQHARHPCPSPYPRVCSNTCLLSWWCHPTISFSVVPFSFCLQSFPPSGSFSNDSTVCIRWPKYWSFSISPSNEYSGLISFRIDWFDPPAVNGTLKNILHVSMLFSWNIPPSPSPTESKWLFYKSVSLVLFCI